MRYVTGLDALPRLVRNLHSSGYTVLGPKLVDGAVCMMEIESAEDLARGIVDTQSPGGYRTSPSGKGYFSAVNGPQSPKKYLHPNGVEMVKMTEDLRVLRGDSKDNVDKKYAFLGLRPCDLQAVRVLDRVFKVPPFEDPVYTPLRNNSILVVANCTRAGENCFCASMGTGPKAMDGYDISITELSDKLLIDITDESMNLLGGIELAPATEGDILTEDHLMDDVRNQEHKAIDVNDPARQVYAGLDSPVWDEVAQTCLSCGNCTMVCPTCFCNTMEEVTDLNDGSVTRVRLWDSCLSKEFTHAAGVNPRLDRKARYRQFVMHKFAYWPDQSGVYGCVGCGRCITWCPVGIDITDTVNRVLKGQAGTSSITEVAKVG